MFGHPVFSGQPVWKACQGELGWGSMGEEVAGAPEHLGQEVSQGGNVDCFFKGGFCPCPRAGRAASWVRVSEAVVAESLDES